MILVQITNRQGVTTTHEYHDDLQAQAVVLMARANGCEARIVEDGK